MPTNEIVAGFMVLVAWVTDLPVPPEPPAVTLVSQEVMCARVYKISPAREYCVEHSTVRAAYGFGEGVYLLAGWDSNNVRDAASLVHELTHYLQNMSNQEYQCKAAKEKEAYDTEEVFLKMVGREALALKNASLFQYLFTTTCGPNL